MTTHEESPSKICQEHGGEVPIRSTEWDACGACGGVFCVRCIAEHACFPLDGWNDDGTDDPEQLPDSMRRPLADLPEISVERQQVTLRSGRVVNEHGPNEKPDDNFTPAEDEADEPVIGVVGTDLGASYTPVLVKIAPMEAEMLRDVAVRIHEQVGFEMERQREGQ